MATVQCEGFFALGLLLLHVNRCRSSSLSTERKRLCCTLRELVKHILELPMQYPGPHNESQPPPQVASSYLSLGRNTDERSPLDTTRQLTLIWDATCDFLREQLEHAKGVTVKGFGSFLFERNLQSGAPKVRELGHVGVDRQILQLRFVISDALRTELSRQPAKEPIERGHISGSIFQLKDMTFLNPVAIAAGCSLPENVVSSGLAAIFKAIKELTRTNYDITLNFKFAVVRIVRKRLTCVFNPEIKVAAEKFINNDAAKQQVPVSRFWKECHLSKSMRDYLDDPSPLNMRERRARAQRLANADLHVMSPV